MADDIDIEEHDVLDHPAIKNMFPDLSMVKHEIMDFDGDPTEITEVSQDSQQHEVTQPDSTTEDLETLLAAPIKIEDSDSYTREEDTPAVTDASEHPSSFDDVQVSVDELRQPSQFHGNKIILGTKPKRNMEKILNATSFFETVNEDKCGIIKDNCDLELDEIRKCLAAKLVLKNWGEYLENSKSFCSDCDILFATVNSFDAHKMQAHSFLVAVQERSVTPVSPVPEANVTDVSTTNIKFRKTQCQVCSRVFASKGNLHRHYMTVHHCQPPSIVLNEPQTPTVLPSRQVAKKRTAPKIPKITIKIEPPKTEKETSLYTIKRRTVVAKPAIPKVVQLPPAKPTVAALKSPAIPKATDKVAAPKVKQNPKPKSDLVCGHCHVEYPSKEDLINHLYDLLTPKTLPSNECNQCDAKFNTKPELAKHKLSHLPKIKSVAKNLIAKQVGEKPPIEGTKQYHRCQICTFYISLKQSRVKRHMELYHKTVKTVKYICSGFIPKCQLCGLNLANPKGYNSHIKIVHRKDNYKRTIPVAVKPQMVGRSKPKVTQPMIGSSKPKATQPTAGTSKPKATLPTFAASKLKTKQFAPNKLQPKSIRFGIKSLQDMKNPPIPQSSLFKCPRCRTHFATHLSAYYHMWQCHGRLFRVFKCNKCNVMMKQHNKALHEKQHLFTDDFEIVTISKDKKASFKYLSNCPKCGIHFKELKFWKHYTDCGKSSIDSFYCTDCDLLIDAALKHSHRALHKTPGEFKIFEYAAIDDAANERFEANTDTTSKCKASQPVVGTSRRKAKLPTVGTTKPKASFAASKLKTKQFASNKFQPKSIRFGIKSLQDMKNPPIPQTSLFKCPRCPTHFATHLSAYYHMWQCHGKLPKVFKCNKCNVMMKQHNKALHEKQHLFTDDFEIVTISKDKRASFKYLSNCPKCGVHFKEIKFWLHYADCGKLSIDSFYCTDCDLLIDAKLKHSHRALHKIPGAFKIFEYAAIDDAANERFEANSAAVNTDTTREAVKKAAQAAPKIFSPKLKSKAEAPKGRDSKVVSSKLKVGRIPPAKTNASKAKASLKRKRTHVSDESFTPRKKAKISSKRGFFCNRNLHHNLKLRYCDTCHRYVPFGCNAEYHKSKLCVKAGRPILCTRCGIALTRGPLQHHLDLHKTHKNLTLHDFKFYELRSDTRINPPLPRLIYCTNCKTYIKKRKRPGEKLAPHNCKEEQFTCETCDIKVNEFGYEIHKSFHAYDMNRGKASEELSENLSELTKDQALSKRQQTVLRTLYQCTTCDVMMTENHVEEHKNFKYDCHNLKKVYQRCGYCNFSILSRDFREHAREHETDRSLCKDNFTIILFDKAVKNKHAADDNKKEGEYKKFKVYKCEECELCVEPRKQVRFHQCDKQAKTYYCPVCEVHVHRTAHIHKHGMYSDFLPENIDFINFSTDRGEVKIDDAWDSNSEGSGKYKLYKCRNCEMCLELPQINIHKCYPHSKKYVCPICKYVFLHYRAHLRNHELKPDFVRSNIKIVEFGKKLENTCASEKITKDTDNKKETTPENVTDSEILQKLLIESSEEIDDFTLYACKKCNINFYKPSVVQNHACAKQTTPYRCLPCRLTFDSIGYKTHILLHSKHADYKRSSFNIESFEVDPKSTTYSVPQNGTNVTEKQELLSSTSLLPDTTVNDGAVILYKCLCGLHFLCRETLDEHQAVCSPIHRASGQCCTKCNLHFTPQTLYKHLIQHHDIKAGEFRYRIREADLGASVDIKTIYKCSTCETHFVNKLILKDHYREQTCEPEALNQECPNCGLEFHYTTNLVKHNQLHHGISDFQEADFEVVVLDKTDFPDLEDKKLTKFKLCSDKQVTEEDYSTKEDAAKTLFKCRKCEMHFMLESALIGHLSRNCESKQETCFTCGLSFAVNTLRRHTQLHHDQLNLTSVDFHIKYQDGSHEKKPPKKRIDVISQSENVLHKCIKCNLYFMSEQSYRQHIRSINTHWSCKPRKTCEICNIVMPTATYYRHKQRHHFKQNLTLNDFTIVEYSNEDELNDRMEYERLISDEYYTKVLKTRYNQELHKCDKCDLHFMTDGALAVHVLKFDHKTPKDRSVLTCDDCGLNFLEQSLVRHKYIHHEKMRFARDELEIKSEVTPKNIRNKSGMLPQKLYKCRECDNHFINPNTCYRHVSSAHINLKGMIHCDVCKLKFLRPSLKRHMKLHHDKGHNLKDIMVEDYEPVYTDGKDIISNLPKIEIYMAADAPVNRKPNKKERTEEFAEKRDIPEDTAKTRNSKTSLSARLHFDEFDVEGKNVLFKCLKCNLYFLRQGSINSHFSRNHKTLKTLGRCEKCNIFMSFCTLSRHNRIHHAPENDLSFDDFVVKESASIEDNILYKCNKCDIYFLTYRSVEAHVSIDHLKFKEPVTCDKCNITMSKVTLHKHYVLHHSPHNDLRLKDFIIKEYCKQDKSNIEIPDESARVLKRYNEELHKCERCDIHFLTAGALSVHAGSLDHKTPSHRSKLTCDDCGLTFLEQSLLRHKFIHHKTMGLDKTSLVIITDVTSRKKRRKLEAMLPQKMYKCKDCKNHFMNPNTCYRHVSTAHKPLKRMIPCDRCGLRFLKPSLERHKKVHHDEGHMLEDIMVEEYEPVEVDKNNETCALPKIRIYMAGDILEKSESNTSSSQIHKNTNEIGDPKDNVLHKCRDCNIYFLTYRAVKHHLSMYHLKMKTIKCVTCNIEMSVTAHYRHTRLHHIQKNLKLEDFVIKEYPEITKEVDNAEGFESKSARFDKEIDNGTDVDNDVIRENKEMDLKISNSIETEEGKSTENKSNILKNESNTACERDDKGVVNTKRNFKFDDVFTFENSGIPCTRLDEDRGIDRNTHEVLFNAHVDQEMDTEDSKVNMSPDMTEVVSSTSESKIPALMLLDQKSDAGKPANEQTNTSKPRNFQFDNYFAFEDNPQKRKYKSLESTTTKPINRNKRIFKSLDNETTVNAFNDNIEVVNRIVAVKSNMKSITLSQIVRNIINDDFLSTCSSAMQTDEVVDDVNDNDVMIIESDTSDKDTPLANHDRLEIPVKSSLASIDDATYKVGSCKEVDKVLENKADELINFQGSRQDDQSKKNIEHDNIVQNRVTVDSGLEVDEPVDETHLDNVLENLDKSENEVGIEMSCEDEDLKLVYPDDDETGASIDETNVSESPV